MIPVVIEYRPVGFLPWKRKMRARIPGRWSEVTGDQLIAISRIQSGSIKNSEALSMLLGIRRRIARLLDEYHAFSILRNLDLTQSPSAWHSFIIPRIVGLNAPEPRLKGVTFGQFIYGDTYYQNYVERGMEDDLNRFIACFYTSGRFDDNEIDMQTARIARVNIDIRKAIALNYLLIRAWLEKTYTYVFAKPTPGKGRKRTSRGRGWVDVFDAVVGDDIANEEKYAEKPLSIVLRFLNRRIKEYYKHGGKV